MAHDPQHAAHMSSLPLFARNQSSPNGVLRVATVLTARSDCYIAYAEVACHADDIVGRVLHRSSRVAWTHDREMGSTSDTVYLCLAALCPHKAPT